MSDEWDAVALADVSAFGRRLAELLGLERDHPVHADEGLFDDWSLDSLQAFQLIITVETMAEIDVPPTEIPSIFTVGDAYAYYRTLRGSNTPSA